MIHDQSRAFLIGASDASYVTGNWKTETFRKWFKEKLGLTVFTPKWSNEYTNAGTYYEHAVLERIPGVVMDEQVLLEDLNLRVNYDGIVYHGGGCTIYEVKTHKADKPFKVSKQYWRQAQVEMFAKKTNLLYIVAYPLTDEHYRNFFIPVDRAKMELIPVEYDPVWIQREFLPKLDYVSKCIWRGKYPQEAEFEGLFERKSKGVQNHAKGKTGCLRKR